VAPVGPIATTLRGSPRGQTTTMMSMSFVGQTTSMMNESSPHGQEQVSSQALLYSRYRSGLHCSCAHLLHRIHHRLDRAELSEFDSISLAAQIIILAQGKQYYYISVHKKIHSTHGNLQAMTAMLIHTTLQSAVFPAAGRLAE
jgi:hypothetical protein